MRKDTSGLMLTEYNSGGIRIEVVDYGVDEFDGGDWESRHELTKENAEKLRNELEKRHKGSFEQMLIAEFGETFKIHEFEEFCHEHNIKYEHFTWLSCD